MKILAVSVEVVLSLRLRTAVQNVRLRWDQGRHQLISYGEDDCKLLLYYFRGSKMIVTCCCTIFGGET